MDITLWDRVTDIENILFFALGVVFAGVASGICNALKERRARAHTHYVLK